jgi:DNA-binding FadR family transcriptional regulator
MMQFQPLGTRRLYRQIAEQIRDLLASGQYPLGSRLPPERDMAAQLKVSRTSVREAIIALELAGLVEVRIGSGIYVSRVPSAGQSLFEAGDVGPGPFELLKARRVVESEVAAEAAECIEDAALAELEKIVDAMERTTPGSQDYDEDDRKFHVGIAEATHNGALVQTVRMYWDMRRGQMWRKLERHFQTPALRTAVITDHREILHALREHSAAGARRAMQRHLRRVEREFAQNVGPVQTPEPVVDPSDSAVLDTPEGERRPDAGAQPARPPMVFRSIGQSRNIGGNG